jgi:hypothetical protein
MELTITQMAELVSAGRSWRGDWMGEFPAKVNSWRSGRLCARGGVTQLTADAWRWIKEAATKSWRRDPQEPVSSFHFGDGRESMTRFILLPRLSRRPAIAGQDGAYGEDHYRSPCSALHRGVPVGHGRFTTPQIPLRWGENKESNH